MDGVFGFLFFAVFVIIIVISIKNQVTGKSISKCPNCGRGVTKNLFNCPKCGAELKKKCSNCGQWLAINALSCYACHAKCNDMPINNISNNIRKYTQSTNSAKTTNTYNSSTNNSYKNTPRNDNKVCTYHDTYSSGGNCDYHDNKYIPPSYSNLDDIGLVKGKKKNKVETVEEYERSRHRSGAYSVNVNEVQSYDRKNSYSTHSDPVFRQNNTSRNSGNKSKAGLIIALIIIVFTAFPVCVPMMCVASDSCSAIDNFDWSDNVGNESNYYNSNEETDCKYASHPYRNLDSNYIKNEAVLSLLNSVKNESALNEEDSMVIFSHYVKDEDKYQIVTMRTSNTDVQYDFILYYLKEFSKFAFDQYEVYDDESPIINSYVSDNGLRFVQIDYFEYLCEEEEDIDKFYFFNNDLPSPNLYSQKCDYDLSID